jgi:hypothetical protein
MDYSREPPTKGRKKKDKAREKHDRNGTYTAKHVRIQEALKGALPPKPKGPK